MISSQRSRGDEPTRAAVNNRHLNDTFKEDRGFNSEMTDCTNEHR